MSAPPSLPGYTTIGTFFLTGIPGSSPSVLNPQFYGETGGANYTGPVQVGVTSSTGSGANSSAFVAVVDNNIIPVPGQALPGIITSVSMAPGFTSGTGSGYKIGDKLTFNDLGGTGSGAYGIVTGINGSGAITNISLAPSGIVNQLLFSITGSSFPQLYYTSAGSTFAANGVVGAFSTEVSGYYANASALQINLEDLTQALNLISGTSSDYAGQTTKMGTPSQRTALVWYLTNNNGGYTSTTLDSNITVYNFLKNYASITLNTALGGTSEQQVNIQGINSGIAPVQNSLQTQQAFLNSSVSTLQTQISQFSQVINQYFSAIQGAANSIG
jgi:hypothetical protein